MNWKNQLTWTRYFVLFVVLITLGLFNLPQASASFEFQGEGSVTVVGAVLDETIFVGDPFEINWFYPDNPIDLDETVNGGFYNNVTVSFTLNDIIDAHSETCNLSVTNDAEGSGIDAISIFCDNPPFDPGPIGSSTYDTFFVNFEDDEGLALSSDDLPENMHVLTQFWESAQVGLQYDATIIVEGMEFPIKSGIVGEFVSSPDTDEDGILDVWEIKGLDFDLDGNIDIDFPGKGADPMHKDLFLEIDYMASHQPSATVVNDVIAAFADAPQSLVNNPDGNKGINLHIDVDESISHQDELTMWSGFNSIRDSNFGTSSERSDDVKVKAKKYFYRYGLFVHSILPSGASGIAELPGNDFVVSLGAKNCGENKTDNCYGDKSGHPVGNSDELSSTLMHEFGHNLRLRHGGQDETLCKPNYMSVMNYLYQFHRGFDRPLDYSIEKLTTLDESNLNEAIGISSTRTNQFFVGPKPTEDYFTNESIDYNRNQNFTDNGVQADINNQSNTCDGEGSLLTGYTDWDKIQYDFRDSEGFFANGDHPDFGENPELTGQDVENIVANRNNSTDMNCLPPESGDWIITQSCEISSDITSPASVMIQNDSVVTINSGSLTVPSGENLIVVDGSGLKLVQGSTLRILS